MDEHKLECSPENLNLTKEKHGKVVSNLAEACWKCDDNEAAIKWVKRELLVYGEDKAGQAQAWGNLGNYLSEENPEKGMEALEKAIAIGEDCGQWHIVTIARNNLDIEREKQKKLKEQNRKESSAPIPYGVPGDAINVDNAAPDKAEVMISRISTKQENKTRSGSETDKHALSPDPTPTKRRSGTNGSRASSSAVPLSRGGDLHGRSIVSGAAGRSVTTHCIDLVDAYKGLCSATSARGPREREEIHEALNKVSAALFVEKRRLR